MDKASAQKKSASKEDKKNLTTGSVGKNLFQMSAPMVFGILAVLSISLVDTYFVGKLGTKQLAALSFTFPVSLTIASLAIGLSAGAASVVSRAIGRKDQKRACRLTTDSLVLSLIIVAIVSLLGFLTIRPLFSLMGAQGDVLDMIEDYMRIWFISMPFLVIPMVVNGLIRAAGDSLWPSMIMIGAAFINIGLTPLFIFGTGIFPEMGIEGAAFATMIARATTFIAALSIIIFREKMITFIKPAIEDLISSWKEILKIGIPAASGNMVNPLSIGIVTAFLAGFGDQSVAAFGVATRVEAFAAIVMLALSSAIGPIAGQNWGADKKDRVLRALTISFGVCIIWSVVLAVIFWIFGPMIVSAFSPEAVVKEEAALYLKIIPITLWGYGITIIAAGCFNAIGKPVVGLGTYLMRSALFYVPFVGIAVLLFNKVIFVFGAIAAANILAGLLVGFFALKTIKSLCKT